MPKTASSKATTKTTVETKPKTKAKVKALPKKIYLQYAGKEIDEDFLIEKFKLEWCKEHTLTEIKDLKIYYKIDDEKAYFVVNESITIIIDFE